ncbi:NAD-dependent epimerase/dehydratase family protein [Chryseolinea lacunae]|uniref:NAD-dependent epimerase/dehydratase family protein n=1 Tax=Chryseolinea lacunae TaxID=2801331 RepID=A0ABS1KRZ0_9BACT|nr:NAD-dependent epimerase/dehydratase family protein [Chryseolinea lacunae]MBL0742209.1 NAD-dependent epimerase/dehydratase family protein [Chryseolinea lacunae]
MKTILITGGAGFAGSSIALNLKRKYPAYTILAFDNLKRRGSELNIARLTAEGIKFIHGDIRSKEDFESISEKIDLIVEASAEPSVLAGINGTPDYLLNTNLVGTINCLNFATKHKSDFIFLSTSRVYPIEKIDAIAFEERETRFGIAAQQKLPGIGPKGLSEDFSLEGYRSLYGASKLASELLIAEYNQFYGLKTVINRCGVLTGPWQMGKVDQGVIVLWVARHFWKKGLTYNGYGGEGKQVRDILHIDDLFRLLDIQMHAMDTYSNKVFNVGGGNEVSFSLKELTAVCEEVTGNKIEIGQIKENRQADIRIYVTDNSRITAASGWKPEISREKIVSDVFEWLKANEGSLKSILA